MMPGSRPLRLLLAAAVLLGGCDLLSPPRERGGTVARRGPNAPGTPAAEQSETSTRPPPRPPSTTDPAALEVQEDVILHLQEDDDAARRRALEQAAALVDRFPSYSYARFLLAWLHHLAGRNERESEILEPLLPETRAAYTWLFHRDPKEVQAMITCNQVNSCLVERARQKGEDDAWDPFRFIADNEGPVSCSGITVDASACPEALEILGRYSWTSRAENRTAQWAGGDPAATTEAFARILGIREGLDVADVGAGLGFFTFPFARIVGEEGHVYALEIDERLVAFLEYGVQQLDASNVTVVRSRPRDTTLPPRSLDIAVVCEVAGALLASAPDEGRSYFEGDLAPMLRSLATALRPGGRLALADHPEPFRLPAGPGESRTVLEVMLGDAGLEHVRTVERYAPRFLIQIWQRPKRSGAANPE